MKRSNKTLIALLAGSLLLGGTGAALAFGGHPGMGGCDRDGANPMRAVMQLDDLTDAQRSQLDTLRKEQRDAMRKNMDAMRDARRELRDAMDAGADTATIRQLADKQAAQMADMIVARAEARQKFQAILTPQQREKVQQGMGGFGGDGPRHGW